MNLHVLGMVTSNSVKRGLVFSKRLAWASGNGKPGRSLAEVPLPAFHMKFEGPGNKRDWRRNAPASPGLGPAGAAGRAGKPKMLQGQHAL